jgi:hypothetical protein
MQPQTIGLDGHVIDNDRMRIFASFCKKKGFLFF